MRRLITLTLLLNLLLSPALQAKDKARYDDKALRVGLTVRTPQQMAAFYEARGFSKAMIDEIRQQCFITVYVKNKSSDILWLDLSQWQFSQQGQTVTRLDRAHWKQHWSAMNIPLSHQSIFRWTLLPERLDFHPDEREGGNIILPRLNNLTIKALFATGADGTGPTQQVIFHDIDCQQ